mgnify:CR=1 FL=1
MIALQWLRVSLKIKSMKFYINVMVPSSSCYYPDSVTKNTF